MQFNARGGAVLAGTVTVGTFRGPPIIACAADVSIGTTTLYWNNLKTLANLLDVPAILIDVVNDGPAGPPALIAKLNLLRPFYSPGSTDPWYHSFSPPNAEPPCGPLFFFDYISHPDGRPNFASIGTGAWLAAQISALTVRAPRGSHFYGFAMFGIWPQSMLSLDTFQHPPIHTFNDPGFSQLDWWTGDLLSYWRSGMPRSTSTSFARTYTQGLLNLALVEPTYPGITRHFLPTLVAPDIANRLLVIAP